MKITKAVREALRRELVGKGFAPPDIALVMAARYRVRPRLALRWAHGMTLDDVAAAWNQLDGSGRAPMTARRVSDYERWPDGGKRPTVYVLLMLTKIFHAMVQQLLDERDFAAMNDKQLFEVAELCRSRTAAVEKPQVETPARAAAQQPAMRTSSVDTEKPSTAAASAANGETQSGAVGEAKETRTKRRQAVQLGGLALAEHVWELLGLEPDRMHAALDAGTVSEERLVVFEQVADRLGTQVVKVAPATLVQDAVAHFRSVRRLVGDRQRTAYQVRLSRVGAKLGTVVGEILFQEGRFDLASEWFQVAQHAAFDAGDRYLADIALALDAILPTYAGDPAGVLALVNPRLGQRCRPTPAIAWLWALKGKAHAARGERSTFQCAMSQARAMLDTSPAQLIGPGVFSFLPERLEFYEATGYVKLGDADPALQAANRALALYDPTETEDPALVRLDKASALAQAGELPEACQLATRAVLDPHTYHAASVLIRAREFDALLGEDRAPAVRDWREVLVTIRRPQPASPSPRQQLMESP